ncbi:MAG: hypothetical protein CXT71_05095 [Methanobacteriota archaeon]|nr:MAG: hypothetical protein CXT71_05095 [Euryarchaeota archaeon]
MTTEMSEDKLHILQGMESCPACGTIANKGTLRCPECGTFHGGLHLEERAPPLPEQRVEPKNVDPNDYSVNPDSAIVDEKFEGDESAVKDWKGGSSDFSFEDDEKCLKDELIHSD